MSNLSFVTHLGDGTTKSFTITAAGEALGYFRAEDIHGYVDGVEVATAIDPSSPHLLIFAEAPPNGSEVLIRRIMPVEKPYADFERGNNFGTRQINNTFLQQLYLTQEILDGFFPQGYYVKQDINMGGNKFTNMGTGSESGDSINFDQFVDESEFQTQWNESQDTRITALETSIPLAPSYVANYQYIAVGGELQLETNRTLSYVLLSINGVSQTIGTAFRVLGTKIILADELEEGDEVFAVLSVPFSTGTISLDSDAHWIQIATGGEVSFDTGATFKSALLAINGVLQTPTLAYETVGSVIHLAEPLQEGDELFAILTV